MFVKNFLGYTAILACALILAGFSAKETDIGQPLDERKAQEALPQSRDVMWAVLGKCKVHLDVKNYRYSIQYTPEVKAMEGKQLTISGFVLPLESTETFSHFLLSKRTPTCFFCPPGAPNEVVEVFVRKPIAWDEGMIAVTGAFGFTSNPELGLFFQIKEAEIVKPKP